MGGRQPNRSGAEREVGEDGKLKGGHRRRTKTREEKEWIICEEVGRTGVAREEGKRGIETLRGGRRARPTEGRKRRTGRLWRRQKRSSEERE